MASTVTTRWTGRLRIREGLLAAARRRLAYRERQHKHYHGRNARLAVKWHRLADRARIEVAAREEQVAEARRVLARHKLRGVSPAGVEFIASFEGGQSPDGMFRPYFDKHGGVWTIGYGHTGGVGPNTKPMTKAQALALLRDDLNEVYCPPVLRVLALAGMAPRQGLVDALTSAVYNLGPGVLERGRSLGDAIRSRNYARIAGALLLYDKAASGERLPGLVRRRKAEAAVVRAARP